MVHHAANDIPLPPQPRPEHVWSAHEIVNAKFVKLPEKSLRAVLKLIASVCVERGFDVASLLANLEPVAVPDHRYLRPSEDSRSAAMLAAPYSKLTDNMLQYAFRNVAAAATARGIDPAEILNL